jgi:hypothetical protein
MDTATNYQPPGASPGWLPGAPIQPDASAFRLMNQTRISRRALAPVVASPVPDYVGFRHES